METKIMKCSCEHEYQDKKYGKGRRVFNKVYKHMDHWRCTVCKTLKVAR